MFLFIPMYTMKELRYMPVDEDRSALSKYRLEKAEENLKAAKLLFENKLLSESINRSY